MNTEFIEAEAGPSRKRTTPELIHELNGLLSRETAKTKLRRLATRGPDVPLFNPICSSTTSAACQKVRKDCTRTHFDPIIRPYTDPKLGYCSYLNLCYGEPLFRSNPSLGAGTSGDPSAPRGGTKECRYLHFHVQPSRERHVVVPEGFPVQMSEVVRRRLLSDGSEGEDRAKGKGSERWRREKQWVNCDLRTFDYSVLGQFQVIMADPPWDIHMSLPYGTMTDDELRRLPLPQLQPDWGVLALWVTGRAMELGRELFSVWGYKRVDEVVWVKVNQVERLIRTGRTGHWLNHTCEHLLVAVKLPESHPRDAPIPWDTDPTLRELRRGVDTDVIVAEVRETSRKPEEAYSILERLAPNGRKLELFGRKHNARPGWVTLGNQLGDSQLAERDVWERMGERYPEQDVRLVE
ncbi:putative mRNA methyltransferase [Dioszegia hungarica]|uniref:mRNA m(6)A methyltransferase n=1 Tax=Dioszegia hungarica TaxID=4972 RepID=A0AA38HC56_9TREE|nr:putative mRNA methyltransferase [Dioszegia hungarica]KAI9637327.1 putative mRNA methyltransferase [Dioszegia hungarica]